MSSWNYRILATEYDIEILLEMYEVYYDEEGKPNGYAANPATLCTETVKGLKWVLDKMIEATDKPILWAGDKFPQEYSKNEQSKKGRINKT